MTAADPVALYRAPLSEFVSRRTALSRELRAAGDREAAARVARLPRPTLSAWAIDQVATGSPQLILDLLAAAREAVEAQREAAGGAGAEALRLATARVRALVDEATGAAEQVLTTSGHPLTEAMRRRLRTTLQAASSAGPQERGMLWRGTLDRDVDPPGFGTPAALDGDLPALAEALGPRIPRPASGTRPPPVAAPSARPGPSVHERRAAERELATRRTAAEQARDTARRLRERAERLADEAATARDDAEAAERARAEAEGRLAAVERTLADLGGG